MWIKTVSGRLVNSEYLKQIALIKKGDTHELYGLWGIETHPTRQNSVIIASGDYDYCSMTRDQIVFGVVELAGGKFVGGKQQILGVENEQA